MTEPAWTVESALAQIEKCDYENEAGMLKNNAAWRWLISQLLKEPVSEHRTIIIAAADLDDEHALQQPGRA